MTSKQSASRQGAKAPRPATPYNGVAVALAALSKPDKPATHLMLAKLLGLTRGAISLWGGVIPPLRVPDVARVTGVPREKLRPDLYGPLPPMRQSRRRKNSH